MEHRSIVNHVLAMTDEVALNSADRLLAVTTISFDIAALEIFGPLANGGTCVIADEAQTRDGATLVKLIEEAEISIMQATPATWRLLCDSGWSGSPRLRGLCGGEALPVELASRLVSRLARVWNVYGPTETAVWSLVAELPGEIDAGAVAVPIGRPIANTRLFVVGEGGG
ncbi:AMP-binding protein, partial [Melissospora conviva]|uniref:AMP-binding protein n=1 Tax=Melissospora conviva TaxID=3388432 RepID=UPI003B7A4D9D